MLVNDGTQMTPCTWFIKFAFYPFSTHEGIHVLSLATNPSTISPFHATKKFQGRNFPSMGKLLTPIGPSWKQHPLASNPPFWNNPCNYDPLQTWGFPELPKMFFTWWSCINLLSNWRLAYNTVKVSFCKKSIIAFYTTMVAFGLGQSSLRTSNFLWEDP
jgi:hypothetical protein